jgi:hypothetical protein
LCDTHCVPSLPRSLAPSLPRSLSRTLTHTLSATHTHTPQSDGKLVTSLGVAATADNAAELAIGANVQHAFMDGRMLTLVAWAPGSDPSITVVRRQLLGSF